MPEQSREWQSAHQVLEAIGSTTEFLGRAAPTVNDRGIFGNSPLKIAAVWGDAKAIRLLVQAGARVNDRNEDGYTALHHAASQGHLEAVRELVNLGADPSVENNEGRTPLNIARGREVVGYLSKARA